VRCLHELDGAAASGPRYFDPVTQNEKSQLLIWMFMQSS
jgi:hypothetical protein